MYKGCLRIDVIHDLDLLAFLIIDTDQIIPYISVWIMQMDLPESTETVLSHVAHLAIEQYSTLFVYVSPGIRYSSDCWSTAEVPRRLSQGKMIIWACWKEMEKTNLLLWFRQRYTCKGCIPKVLMFRT